MKNFKKLQSFKQFRENDMIQEKWYHNVLAGLMMLSPGISQAVDLNVEAPQKVQTLGEEEAYEDIQAIIDYVRANKKDFKNVDKIVRQLKPLMNRVKSGKIGEVEAMRIAKGFIEQAKDLEYPVLKTSDEAKSGWIDVTDYSQVIEKEVTKPKTIEVEILSDIKVDFNSGAYNEIDEDLVTKVGDSISELKKLGYELKQVRIESSTDGQGLSPRLKRDLKSKGYSADNKGLSEIRNDKMLDALKGELSLDSSKIEQVKLHKDDGVIDASERYNKVVLVLEVVNEEETTSKEIVKVYYKVSDRDMDKIKTPPTKTEKTKPLVGKGKPSTKCYRYKK